MTDEYFQIGKSLAEIYGLIENDPWQEPVDEQKLAAEKDLDALQKRILDRLKEAGCFEKPSFDPTEDDDPTIVQESTLTMFWRLTVHGRRMDEVLAVEPSIEKIALTFKNTKIGCWIAFTGKRVAARIEASLNDQGMLTQLSVCDIHGKVIDEC